MMRSISVILVLLSLLVTGCIITTSVADKPPYDEMLGKEYILQRDCYITRYFECKKVLCLEPVGLDTHGPDDIRPSKEINYRLIGKKLADIEVLGVLPKYTHVKVVDVKHLVSFEYDYYEIYMESDIGGRQVYAASGLQKQSFGEARLDERFVKKVEPERKSP